MNYFWRKNMKIYLKSLLEQKQAFVSYKFEFVGITTEEGDKFLYLKLTSKALVMSLMNTKTKETDEAYSYNMRYINASKNMLENQLGLSLQFSEKLSKMGNIVFKLNTGVIGKELKKKLYAITFVPIMVSVKKQFGGEEEPADETPPAEEPAETPAEGKPVEKPVAVAETPPPQEKKKKQPNQYSAL